MISLVLGMPNRFEECRSAFAALNEEAGKRQGEEGKQAPCDCSKGDGVACCVSIIPFQ